MYLCGYQGMRTFDLYVSQAVSTGRLSYPYSTRELVNLVRHIQLYPGDALHNVTDNVISFDKHNVAAINIVKEIFSRHGIPLLLSGVCHFVRGICA